MIETDCGTEEGLEMPPRSLKVVTSSSPCANVFWVVWWLKTCITATATRCCVRAAPLLDEKWVAELEENGVDRVLVRSAITCETRHGICATCYGRDLARGSLVNQGESGRCHCCPVDRLSRAPS